ncbi:MAG: hypothetical protein R6U56_00640, partial [Opitutales bacterium]
MADKATLLQSVPPVAEKSASDGGIDAEVKNGTGSGAGNGAGAGAGTEVEPEGAGAGAGTEVEPEGAGAGTGTGTEVEPESDVSMSPFQATTYGSFVLTFILAGFAAVVLFRKGLDVTERR